MRKPSEDHSFHFFPVFCGDGGVGVGGGGGAGLAAITRQRHRGVNKKTRNKSHWRRTRALARDDPSHRPF